MCLTICFSNVVAQWIVSFAILTVTLLFCAKKSKPSAPERVDPPKIIENKPETVKKEIKQPKKAYRVKEGYIRSKQFNRGNRHPCKTRFAGTIYEEDDDSFLVAKEVKKKTKVEPVKKEKPEEKKEEEKEKKTEEKKEEEVKKSEKKNEEKKEEEKKEKDGEEKKEDKKEEKKKEASLKPKVMEYDAKQKLIAQGQKKKKTDYPTMEDAPSDWDDDDDKKKKEDEEKKKKEEEEKKKEE
ncbi:hypothetical protein B9Z55_011696 [Caenorhabditis nigoni]|uniref:Uncharacterized protein n=1 Tax=Caenorhabditis nigoni TaxID=1611254 RepID=A0A2G5UM37_9PELO|nr:hypothetical protein B9Z55_011696 [Caenorhabditis nigoni]